MLRDALLALALATGFVLAAHIVVSAVTTLPPPEPVESESTIGP